ncbi:hypothetical protein BDR26DRAFT_917450 [Obelidium mucronatum]|nr:hypothetical protein BDR26DRAFT_917450 [Obelidium mucronatum]
MHSLLRSRAIPRLAPHYSRAASNASNKPYDPFARSPRAAPELPLESAAELWTNRQLPPKPLTHVDTFDAAEVLAHPLRTPPAKPYVGLGEKLLGPMKWPEFDQSGLLAAQNPKIKSPPGPDPSLAYFEDPLDAPIGAYPRITHQFTELKDPFKYWDKQGRRNYGDIVADQELQMNQWSHGPGHAQGPYIKAIAVVLATFFAVYQSIDFWSPEHHLWQAERDYPFNGLHLELGADPNDLGDSGVTAAYHHRRRCRRQIAPP